MSIPRDVDCPGSDGRLLRKAHDYCVEHMSEPISDGDLAAAAGSSRWHFARQFRQLEGMSPHEFILDVKLRMAQRLLQSGNSPVKIVAQECGFEDVSYFCRVFKAAYGSTPGEYRQGQG